MTHAHTRAHTKDTPNEMETTDNNETKNDAVKNKITKRKEKKIK